MTGVLTPPPPPVTEYRPEYRPSCSDRCNTLLREVWLSTDLLFQSKLTWLLILGPVALVGDATGLLGEFVCFLCSGIALIPCAERLSFVTEQVAAHTNGTIGALLNATFGNAPELLISTAALRSGFYRVVQLAMLGSMLTNLLFVFGVSCLVGGLRWQVQELRITSGNVSVLLLLVATAGSLLPAALNMSGQMKEDDLPDGKPSEDELAFSRINAFIMVSMYISYLMFQLGTHKEEFDEEDNIVETPDNVLLMSPYFTSRHPRRKRAERNRFCLKWFDRGSTQSHRGYSTVELLERGQNKAVQSDLATTDIMDDSNVMIDSSDISDTDEENTDVERQQNGSVMIHRKGSGLDTQSLPSLDTGSKRSHRGANLSNSFEVVTEDNNDSRKPNGGSATQIKSNDSEIILQGAQEEALQSGSAHSHQTEQPQMSLRVGIVWLFIITLCISAMSDILVDTIDGFAYRCHISEVFTSMVIVPFFSNVAEQVSAIIFAYRNEMDLCVGVTVGSAIQVATFVLPGCVLIGMFVDRSMTLFFRGYETCCLFLSVVVVAAILQGGTTNWLVGTSLIGVYVMIAAGFWFHELENLSTDAELIYNNDTNRMLL